VYTFTYERPASLQQALALIDAGGQALAGGQTLLASMKQRLHNPEQLVDLSQVPELQGIQQHGNAWRIGAFCRHQDVASHAGLKAALPGLAHLAEGIGDRQVRAMGTLGGSVANNDPAACYPSAVLALGATVHTNQRQIAADDFFQGLYTTALEMGELITAIEFPVAQRAAYAKFKQPASRFALVGVFVAQTASGVRVAITGAGNGVFRHAGLEAALTQSFTPEAVEHVVIDAQELNSDLHASANYRAHLIKVQTQRAVQQALA
jgi:carbon-monoxide dehydrogenase medium subunit